MLKTAQRCCSAVSRPAWPVSPLRCPLAERVDGADDPNRLYSPNQGISEEIWGIEDPRITFVPELQQYVVTLRPFARWSGVSLALTKDFRTFERYGVIMPPDDKTALFPRRMRLLALIHRPMTPLARTLDFYSRSRHWATPAHVGSARAHGGCNKIGLSPPPIEPPRAAHALPG